MVLQDCMIHLEEIDPQLFTHSGTVESGGPASHSALYIYAAGLPTADQQVAATMMQQLRLAVS